MKWITLTAAVLCAAAPAAFAKGHDQGNTEAPGQQDVGSVTVDSAQALGGILGDRPDGKGPASDNPASENAGR